MKIFFSTKKQQTIFKVVGAQDSIQRFIKIALNRSSTVVNATKSAAKLSTNFLLWY